MSIITETERAARKGSKSGMPDVLDFLVTEERLGVTFVTEGLGIGYGTSTGQAGRFYEYPGDPFVRRVGIAVSHTIPM